MADWISTYLRTAGYPDTPKNRQFLASWQRWEGGHTKNDARFNYLNTTQDMGGNPSINRFGVRRYSSLDQGAKAFAKTLKNGRYTGLDAALAAGDPYTKNAVDGLSIWLSGKVDPAGIAYASRVLGTHLPADRAPQTTAAPNSPFTSGKPAGPIKPNFSGIASGDVTPMDAFGDVASAIRQGQSGSAKMPRLASSVEQLTGAPQGLSQNALKFVTLAPGADRQGVPTQPQVLQFVGALGEQIGEPLTIGTGSNHKRITQDGFVSDHWDGKAADVPAKGAKLMRFGYLALVQAGMPQADAKKAAAKGGGLFNVGGYQIIFGNYPGHSAHLHVGVRS